MNTHCFSRSNWNKKTPDSNPIPYTEQYSSFATDSKNKKELHHLMNKEIPTRPYIITVNSQKYEICLYQSQWNALRSILLNGHVLDFNPLPTSVILDALKYKYANLTHISEAIKTAEILIVYLENGLSTDKLNIIIQRAKEMAASYAADGKLY